ncbi:MAG: O-antigen ligase family protein [Solirubrobacteraceae bacterium]
MRAAVLTCARFVLLCGPVALAFFSGGYFDGPRAWAGLIAWLLVGVAAAAAPGPPVRSRIAWLAVIGLLLFAAWTLLSYLWSPVIGTAYDDGQRVFMYAGMLIAAAWLLRGRVLRVLEPAVAASSVVVIGYGMSERLLPWLLSFQRSAAAQGRLEQPLTYWNAMGAVAAIGIVLCAHLAGDRARDSRSRIAAAAAAPLLGLGLYSTFSRGAIFACVAGLVTLVVIAPTRAGLRGIAVAAIAAVAGALAGAPFAGVASLSGSHHTRVLEGTVVLVIGIVLVAAAGWVEVEVCRRERSGRLSSAGIGLPRHAGAVAIVIVVAAFGVFRLAGDKESNGTRLSGGAARLTTLQSNRYAYWKVAWRAFEAEPIRGVGGGGWAIYWLRYRPFNAGAQDAHSLYIQTAAELGLIGLALLAATFTGVVVAARRALARAPALAAGPAAALVVWAAHVAVDWDWEMPAVTLLAIVLAGGLLSLCDFGAPEPASAPAQP